MACCYSTKGCDSHRQFTRDLYLSSNEGSVRVCKTMFLATLGIRQLSRALNSQVRTGEGTPIADKRGKHLPANKTPADQIGHGHGHAFLHTVVTTVGRTIPTNDF